MVKKNLREPTGAREKAINPSISGPRPAHTSHAKYEIQLRLEGRNKKHQINTWGGINRKTLAVQT